jgi:hypothetical protein
MSGALMVVVGAVLALTGVLSIRLAVVLAAAGASWLVADAFAASAGTGLLIAAAGGVLGLLLAVFAADALFFVMGLVAGAVAGARLFVLLDRGDASVLLAVVFVPAVAGCFAALASRWRKRFLAWATAIAGAALVLGGLGRLGPEQLRFLAEGEGPVLQSLSVALWIGLTVAARWAQAYASRSGERPFAASAP